MDMDFFRRTNMYRFVKLAMDMDTLRWTNMSRFGEFPIDVNFFPCHAMKMANSSRCAHVSMSARSRSCKNVLYKKESLSGKQYRWFVFAAVGRDSITSRS